MTKGDEIVERGAALLEQLSRKAASEGGIAAKLAEPLADDADFLRKLKPSLVLARLRGEPPPDGQPEVRAHHEPVPPPPAPEPANEDTKPKRAGPNPIVIGAAAFAIGIFLAKLIDWRGHAHPKV